MPTVPYTLDQAEDDISDLRGQVEYLGEVGSALNLNLTGTGGAQFPGTAVTAASLTDIATATISGGDPSAGAVYELDVWGNGVQGTSAQQLEFGVTLAGSAMTNVTYGTVAFGGTPASAVFRWRAKARVICNTTGMSGTWTSYLDSVVSVFAANLGNTNSWPGFSCESTSSTTADTTSDQAFTLQAAWGATTGGPTLTSRVAIFKRIA